MDAEKTQEIITGFIKRKVSEANASGVVIGLSGGIDSAVTAKLCANALGNDCVLALIMPTGVTSENDVSDAVNYAKELEIDCRIINISKILDSFLNEIKGDKKNKTAYGNLMARIRMCVIYYLANSLNRLVAGTGNKSEILCGYFTKFGDGGCDILPIGDLYKTQVRELAEYLKIPDEIRKKVPSAGLWRGQSDEDELGISYELLDRILAEVVDKKTETSKAATKLNTGKDEVKRIEKKIEDSDHKRHTPEICCIKQ
jgi:NAD+ synthase